MRRTDSWNQVRNCRRQAWRSRIWVAMLGLLAALGYAQTKLPAASQNASPQTKAAPQAKAAPRTAARPAAPPKPLECAVTVPETLEAGTAATLSIELAGAATQLPPRADIDFGDGSPHGKSLEVSHAWPSAGEFAWSARVSQGGRSCTRSGKVRVLEAGTLAARESLVTLGRWIADAAAASIAERSIMAGPLTRRMRNPLRVHLGYAMAEAESMASKWAAVSDGGSSIEPSGATLLPVPAEVRKRVATVSGPGFVRSEGLVIGLEAPSTHFVKGGMIYIPDGDFTVGEHKLKFRRACVEDNGTGPKYAVGSTVSVDGAPFVFDGNAWVHFDLPAITDPGLLAGLALLEPQAPSAAPMLQRITAPDALGRVSVGSPSAAVRRAAAKRLEELPDPAQAQPAALAAGTGPTTPIQVVGEEIAVPYPQGLVPVPGGSRFQLEIGGQYRTMLNLVPARDLPDLAVNRSTAMERWALVGSLDSDDFTLSRDEYGKLMQAMQRQPKDCQNRAELINQARRMAAGNSPLQSKPLLVGYAFQKQDDLTSFFFIANGTKPVNAKYGAALCARNVARLRSRLVTFDLCAVPDSDGVVEWVESASNQWMYRVFAANGAALPQAMAAPPSSPLVTGNSAEGKRSAAAPNAQDANVLADALYWQSIVKESDAKLFQDYLEKFPNGQFVELAKRRIQAFEEKARRATVPAVLCVNKGMTSAFGKTKFYLDDRQIALVQPGRYVCFELKAGRHALRSTKSMTLDAEPGQVYYVEFTVGWSDKIHLKDPAQGVDDLYRMKPVDSGKITDPELRLADPRRK
jgi:hypothetical protein